MKKITTISTILLLAILTSCGGRSNQPTGDIITINVTANFPQRELILQDFMDVEYIALDDSYEFTTQGRVLDIGKRYMLVSNYIQDGNILVFSRKTGEGLRVINRRGQGGEEYSRVSAAILDEDNGEIFVKDLPTGRFLVYDLYGNFRRRFNFIEGARYSSVLNYDKNNLLVYRNFPLFAPETTQSSFLIISKQDGRLVREFYIPVEEFRTPNVVKYIDGHTLPISIRYYPILPYRNGWVLMHTSSDTIYNFLPNGDLIPLISIHSMGTELFLFPSVFTSRYYFMQIHRKGIEGDSPTNIRMLPRVNLVYDRQENAIFRVTVYNNDFSNRSTNMGLQPINHEIAFSERFEAYQLVEAYENGELRGRLKEIASKLNEESNPVIMLVKHRNRSF